MTTLNIMGTQAEIITSEVVKDDDEGVEFALYNEIGGDAGFVVIKDLDSGIVAAVTRYPNFANAEAAHTKNLKWARI